LARKALFMRRDLCHSGSEPDRSFVAYSSLCLMLATHDWTCRRRAPCARDCAIARQPLPLPRL